MNRTNKRSLSDTKKFAHYFLFLEFHQKVEKGSEKVEREGEREREAGVNTTERKVIGMKIHQA